MKRLKFLAAGLAALALAFSGVGQAYATAVSADTLQAATKTIKISAVGTGVIKLQSDTKLKTSKHFYPQTDVTSDLGTSALAFRNAYVQSIYVKPAASNASTTEGTVYYNSTDDNLYVYADGDWVDLTAGASGGASLDEAYNNDMGERTVIVDAGSVSYDLADGSTDYDFIVDLQGTGNTFEIQDAGSAVFTVADAGATTLLGTLTTGINGTGHDVRFYSATAGASLLWDESDDKLIVTGVAAADALSVAAGNTNLQGTVTVGVNDTGYDVKFFGATDGSYALWDESEDRLELNGADFNLEDTDYLQLGASQDVAVTWDETVTTGLKITAAANNTMIYLGNDTNDFDITYYMAGGTVVADASGNTVTVDGIELRMNDADEVKFGDAQDVTMAWDGTDFDVLAVADDSVFKYGNGTQSFDLWWYGDAATNTLVADASANTVTFDDVDLVMGDSDVLYFGDSSDIYMRWDGTDFDVLGTANSVINWGVDDDGFDIKYFGDTSGSYVLWDQSDNRLEFDGSDINLQDSDILQFGDAQDVTLDWDGTNLDILGAADDEIIRFGNGTNSFDVIWYGDAATNLVTLNAGANTLTLDGVDFYLGDNDIMALGDGQDVQLRWDATDLDVLAAADDSVIKFGNGTNSFDVWLYGDAAATYVEWDASADTMEFQDNTLLAFGAASDVTIAWDATDLDILAAADDSVIKYGNGTNSFDVWFYGDAATNTVVFDASAKTWTYDDVDVILGDNDILGFGDAAGGDVQFRWDATNFDITDGTNALFTIADAGTTGDVTVSGDFTASGWIKPATGATAPDNLAEGVMAVDSEEQDCFDAEDGTDGGSLCIYDGAAWQVVKTW